MRPDSAVIEEVLQACVTPAGLWSLVTMASSRQRQQEAQRKLQLCVDNYRSVVIICKQSGWMEEEQLICQNRYGCSAPSLEA